MSNYEIPNENESAQARYEEQEREVNARELNRHNQQEIKRLHNMLRDRDTEINRLKTELAKTQGFVSKIASSRVEGDEITVATTIAGWQREAKRLEKSNE